jgi:hypothetical protein
VCLKSEEKTCSSFTLNPRSQTYDSDIEIVGLFFLVLDIFYSERSVPKTVTYYWLRQIHMQHELRKNKASMYNMYACMFVCMYVCMYVGR